METYISRIEFKPDDSRNFEKVKGESMTVSGESYTINELFARHMNGMIANIERPSFYEDTQDFDAIDFDRLRHADPFEKEQLFKEVEAKAKKARQAIADYRKKQLEESEGSDDNVHFTKTAKSSKATKSSSGATSKESKSEAQRSTNDSTDAPSDAD